nr:hypothetical protein [Arthrobacter sp. B6]
MHHSRATSPSAFKTRNPFHHEPRRANNTAIKNIERTARGYRNAANYKSDILLRSAVRTAA